MAKFEVYKSESGEFRFRLTATNGQNILSSEGYASKAAAMDGIASVGKNANRKGAFSTKGGRNKQYFFTLKSSNGEVIGASQGYADDASCKKGMEAVRRNGGAEVADLT